MKKKLQSLTTHSEFYFISFHSTINMNSPFTILSFLVLECLSFYSAESKNYTYNLPENDSWEDPVHCPNSSQVVTGFQLSFDYQDPNNQEDKTILNNIWLACGTPFQSERLQESSVSWVSGGGTVENGTFLGVPEQKLYCEDYAIGVRLREIPKRLFWYGEANPDDAGIINLKIVCANGEELEGHEEKWDFFPAAEYSVEPMKCEGGMALCGVEAEMKEIKLVGKF